MTCTFCTSESKELINDDNYPLYTSVEGHHLYLYYSAYSGDSDIDTNIKINYCPMCGRNLKELKK